MRGKGGRLRSDNGAGRGRDDHEKVFLSLLSLLLLLSPTTSALIACFFFLFFLFVFIEY